MSLNDTDTRDHFSRHLGTAFIRLRGRSRHVIDKGSEGYGLASEVFAMPFEPRRVSDSVAFRINLLLLSNVVHETKMSASIRPELGGNTRVG